MENKWHPGSWREHPALQQPRYANLEERDRVLKLIGELPRLVLPREIKELKKKLALAAQGKAFVLQGGDCVESFAAHGPASVTARIKVLRQTALILSLGLRQKVVCVGRLAGQYSKPRSNPTELRGHNVLPAFRGEGINGMAFTANARHHDPWRLLLATRKSVETVNLIRAHLPSLPPMSFAWPLASFRSEESFRKHNSFVYRSLRRLSGQCQSLRALASSSMPIYVSHEGLVLELEQALTRFSHGESKAFNLGAHMLWIGERTRGLDGAHVEFFRGIANPIGIKVGPSADGEEIAELVRILNPSNEWGRITLIPRLGVDAVADTLPPLIASINKHRLRVLWSCDPMHGNGQTLPCGRKTRAFVDICGELLASFAIHRRCGSRLGGLHLEMSSDDVTECVGGATEVEAEDVAMNYTSLCDPRLNRTQSLEIASAAVACAQKTHPLIIRSWPDQRGLQSV